MTQETQKKGLSPLAWVGIGCGLLLVLGGIAVVAGVSFLGYKAKGLAEELEKNPTLVIAKGIDLADPSIELVDTNETDQTFTFKKTETGEEYTISFEDIENGNLSWTTPEGTFGIDTTEAQEGGKVTFSGPDGETVIGGGDAANIPDWVILPPKAFDVQNSFAMSNAESSAGTIGAKSEQTLDEVKEFYQKALEDAGYEVSLTSFSTGNTRQEIVTGTRDNGQQTLNAAISKEGTQPTAVFIQYQGPGTGG